MTQPEESRAIIAESLGRAYQIGGNHYVTRGELKAEIEKIEVKLSNVELKVRNWVLGGVLAIIVAFGSGYISMVGKLDKISDALPSLTTTVEGRRTWMMRQDQRDDKQDQVLKDVKPDYQPLPYTEPPK